jgi:hypothetical protein
MAQLRRVLSRRKKAELVDTLLELAQTDRGVLRQLTTRFDVAAAPDELVAATRQAIADAAAFDRRDINRNFAYDYEAYHEVKRNLRGRLLGVKRVAFSAQKARGIGIPVFVRKVPENLSFTLIYSHFGVKTGSDGGAASRRRRVGRTR